MKKLLFILIVPVIAGPAYCRISPIDQLKAGGIDIGHAASRQHDLNLPEPAAAASLPALFIQDNQSQSENNGRQEAAAACEKASFQSDRRECLAIVAKSRHFDINAANLCGELDFSGEIKNCVAAIADKTYLWVEIRECSKSSIDSTVVNCLQKKGLPYADNTHGREEAYSACEKALFPPDRQECIAIVSKSHYFDINAAGLCKERDFSGQIKNCVAAIANKTYLWTEIRECSKSSIDSMVVNCLQKSGLPL